MSRWAFKDETGKRHGTWLVVRRAPTLSSGSARWLCVCEQCGHEQVNEGIQLRRPDPKPACKGCGTR